MRKFKKSKQKINWLKQVGYFLFKHPVSQKSGSVLIDVYFKNEYVGVVSCVRKNVNKNTAYYLGIYDFSKTDIKIGTTIGVIECYGMAHGLPKTITKAEMNGYYTILVSQRRVLVEKIIFKTQLLNSH